MKDVYVEETLFGYTAIDEAKAKELVSKGYVSVDLFSDVAKITLVFQKWTPLFSMESLESIANDHVNQYFEYISSITGLDVPVVE